MSEPQLSDKDKLITRPDPAPLPTPIDPSAPWPEGFPDPKLVAKEGQGDPDAKNPAPTDIGRVA